jgi:signal transduction histidine kinase
MFRLNTFFNLQRSLRTRISVTFGAMAIVLTLVLGWLVEQRLSAQVEPEYFNQLQRLIFAYGLGFGVLFVVLGWVLAGRITRPLSQIAQAAQRISQGNSEEVIPTFPGHDEVASLSRSLNQLVADLNQQKEALQKNAATLDHLVAERTRQLAALSEMMAVSNDVEDDLPTLLNRAIAQVMKVTKTKVGGIHLLSQDGQHLKTVADINTLPTVAAALNKLTEDHPLASDILQQDAYLHIRDLAADPRTAPFAALSQNRQLLGFPIRKGKRNLGAFTVLLAEDEPLDDDEIRLLRSLTDQLAVIIENARLRKEAEQLAVVEERNRLARELHDSVTQTLYSATLFAEAGQRNAKAGKMDKALNYLAEVGESSHQALKEMRLLVYKLRPSALDKEGLVLALEQRLKAVEERAGIQYELVAGENLHLSNEVESALYAIAVESLNNALKHSKATAVSLHLSQENGTVALNVHDNGQGFELETARLAGGLGITSLQERVAQLNGKIQFESAPGAGTTIAVQIPTD